MLDHRLDPLPIRIIEDRTIFDRKLIMNQSRLPPECSLQILLFPDLRILFIKLDPFSDEISRLLIDSEEERSGKKLVSSVSPVPRVFLCQSLRFGYSSIVISSMPASIADCLNFGAIFA